MNGEAVKEIANLALGKRAPTTIEIHGKTHLLVPAAGGTWEVTERGGPGLRPETLAIHTLAGFVTYVNEVAESRDDAVRDTLVIHVRSHEEVSLITGSTQDGYEVRNVLAVTKFEPLLGPAGVRYGTWMDLETFNVALQSVFADTEDRTKALLVAGTVQDEEVTTSTDDGVSQTVVARAGVVAATRTVVPNPVRLRPFRTFREVEQPESPFILRMRREQGRTPSVALFEADGGKWKLEAIEGIRKFLADKIAGIPIIA